MSDFWVEADSAKGGTVAAMTDDEVSRRMTEHAEDEKSKGNIRTASGIRGALAEGPEKARSYLAMMRVVSSAAKSIRTNT